MGRINVLATGLALAITMAVVNSLCAVAVLLWHDGMITFANAWAHGLDLQVIKATAPMTFDRFFTGLAGIAAVGFVFGALYAAIYNLVRNVGGKKQQQKPRSTMRP